MPQPREVYRLERRSVSARSFYSLNESIRESCRANTRSIPLGFS